MIRILCLSLSGTDCTKHITGKQLLFVIYNCFKVLPRGRGIDLMTFREFHSPRKSVISQCHEAEIFKKSHRGPRRILYKHRECHLYHLKSDPPRSRERITKPGCFHDLRLQRISGLLLTPVVPVSFHPHPKFNFNLKPNPVHAIHYLLRL